MFNYITLLFTSILLCEYNPGNYSKDDPPMSQEQILSLSCFELNIRSILPHLCSIHPQVVVFNLIKVFATSAGILLYQIKSLYHESTFGHVQPDLFNVNSHLSVARMILVVVWQKIQHPHLWLCLINLGKHANDRFLSTSTKSLWCSSQSQLMYQCPTNDPSRF